MKSQFKRAQIPDPEDKTSTEFQLSRSKGIKRTYANDRSMVDGHRDTAK